MVPAGAGNPWGRLQLRSWNLTLHSVGRFLRSLLSKRGIPTGLLFPSSKEDLNISKHVVEWCGSKRKGAPWNTSSQRPKHMKRTALRLGCSTNVVHQKANHPQFQINHPRKFREESYKGPCDLLDILMFTFDQWPSVFAAKSNSKLIINIGRKLMKIDFAL